MAITVKPKFGQYQRMELGFGLDNFGKPITYSNKEAWTRQVLQLAVLEPGTIMSNPSIGIGVKRYDFLMMDDRHKLEMQINEQVPKFYPDMPFNNCKVELPSEEEDQDILYLLISFTISNQIDTVVVAVKKGYHYIDYAIAM